MQFAAQVTRCPNVELTKTGRAKGDGAHGDRGVSGYMSVGAGPGRRQARSGSWPGSKISA
jgi:hypothetical protein